MKTKKLKTAGFALLILFLYFLVFVFMTYPLILRFSSAIPGNGGDQYLMTWFFWEFYHYVFVLHRFPYFTHLVYYPFGVPLYVTTDMPVNSFIASVIYYFSHNLLLAFNIIFLLSSLLNGYFAYLLAKDVLKNKTASFFAGLIFAFSPVLIEQMRWGDINIWSCYGIPLYILFFNRLYKEPKTKNAVGAAAGLFLATYAGFYEFTAMLLVYSLFFIVYRFIEENYKTGKEKPHYVEKAQSGASGKIRETFLAGLTCADIKQRFLNNIRGNRIFNRKYIKSLLLMTGLFVLVSSPFLFPAVYYVYLKPGILELNPTLFWTKAYSSTFINLFIPPFFNHALLPLTKAIYFNKFYPIIDRGMNSNNFLGYVPILFFTAGIYYYFKLKKKSGLKIYNINKSIENKSIEPLNSSGVKNIGNIENNIDNNKIKNNGIKNQPETENNIYKNAEKEIDKDELDNFKFYLTAFIFFLLMALSPLIHIADNIRVFDPFVYILDILPVIKDVQESGRYMIIGMLFFGICAGFGLKYFLESVKSNPEMLYKYNLSRYIINKIQDRKSKKTEKSKETGMPIKTETSKKTGIEKNINNTGKNSKNLYDKISYISFIAAVFIFTIAGYSSFGFEMRDFKITKGIYKLKKAPYGPVLVIPFIQGGFKMYQQTIYQKPMYAGYVIRYGFHNLYKKYLPYRFYDAYGENYKTNYNQVDIYRLGMPNYLIRNFKYLKILKVKYLLILKNRLDGYAGVYNDAANPNYTDGKKHQNNRDIHNSLNGTDGKNIVKRIVYGSAVKRNLTPLEIKQKSLYYINKFIKAEKGKVGVLYNGKNIMILILK
ncbi:MAG: hypothetical protein EVJ46_07620 [Candidatus Acididesulfobacter guangdongensis]|uniref:Uncharacterized protein n=1 Tax=Acididesulfobacter guangdongensis TaxID=2597225 RepID=A0A519BFK7_ACIG2|nr:MAG: hypothetical protein EVJ46_07620 [Candidatus Acididesulfobacter guangdongensis]